jgi:hypothetical protein
MTDEISALSRIEAEIADLENKERNLSNAFEEKKMLLANKKGQQEKILIEGDDSSEIVAEIVEFQVEIQGLFRALKTTQSKLDELRSMQKKEKDRAGIAVATQSYIDALNIAVEVYLDFIEIVERKEALKSAVNEYRRLLKPSYPEALANNGHKLLNLYQAIEKGLFPVLDFFPKEILENKDLPGVVELRSKLRGR